MIQQNISAGIEEIQDNIKVIRAKFQPLLEPEFYIEDVTRLINVVPQMLDNVEAMVEQLNNAFEILNKTPKKE